MKSITRTSLVIALVTGLMVTATQPASAFSQSKDGIDGIDGIDGMDDHQWAKDKTSKKKKTKKKKTKKKKKAKVEELESEQAENPAAVFQHGVELLTAGGGSAADTDWQGAYSDFNKAAELGGSPKAHFNAAWVAEILGNNASAEKHYRAAYAKDPTYEASMFSLARVLMDSGKADEAVDLYRSHIEKNPSNLEVRNDLIVALTAAERYDEGIAEAQELLRQDAKNADVYRALSAMYFKQGNLGMSQLCNEKALKLNDGDPGTYNNLGVTFLIRDDLDDAIDKFKMAIKLDSKGFEANANLGFLALNSGDYTLALTSFQAATEANPANVDSKIGLAVAYRGTKQYEQAESIYDDIIVNDPTNQVAAFNAATLHEKYTHNFGKALKYLKAYKDAATVGPEHEVFGRIARVEQSKLEEEKRLAAIALAEKEERDRLERNKVLLKEMSARLDPLAVKIQGAAGCLDEGSVEMGLMIVEQAKMVVDAEEADMAPDISAMLDDFEGQVDEFCSGGGTQAAPAEEPAEATEEPAEATEEPAEATEEGG